MHQGCSKTSVCLNLTTATQWPPVLQLKKLWHGKGRGSTKVTELWVSDRRSKLRALGSTICKLRGVSPFCLLRELWNTEVLNAKSLFAGACTESHVFIYRALLSTRESLSPVEIIGMEEAGMFYSRSQPRDQMWSLLLCRADSLPTEIPGKSQI